MVVTLWGGACCGLQNRRYNDGDDSVHAELIDHLGCMIVALQHHVNMVKSNSLEQSAEEMASVAALSQEISSEV
mgnify:CR=1 FL=1